MTSTWCLATSNGETGDDEQIRQVVTKLQENDEVRDSMLNNDEETQIQVIHDNISTELGIIDSQQQ